MKISRRGAKRLLDRVRAESAPAGCADCQDALPELADAVLAGASAHQVDPLVAEHLDCCSACESLFVELLESLETVVTGRSPVAKPQAVPDLSFLRDRSPATRNIWRMALESTITWFHAAERGPKRLRISLTLPAAAAAVHEAAQSYEVPRRAAGVLASGPVGDKLLFARALPGPERFQVELRATRESDEICRVLADVDSLVIGAPRPARLRARSGGQIWADRFDEVGQAVIVVPIESLADIVFEIEFRA